MLDKIFEIVRADAIKAAGPQLEVMDPTKDYVTVDADGRVDWFGGRPAVRRHEALDLETVVNFAKRFHDDGKKPAVWYSRAAVVCLIDDADRRDKVTLALQRSEQLEKLFDLERGKSTITQKQLIFMLRTIFKNSMGPCPKLIEILRQVRFESKSEGTSAIGKGKSSIGRAISAEISGQGELPEYVTLTIPVFKNQLGTGCQEACCVLEPDEATQTFQLFPCPGELERVIVEAEAAIHDKLGVLLGEDAEIPVYYGQP